MTKPTTIRARTSTEALLGSESGDSELGLANRFFTHQQDGFASLNFLLAVLGLSKHQVCQGMGISNSALGHFIHGRRRLPTERRRQLLHVLEDKIAELRTLRDNMKRGNKLLHDEGRFSQREQWMKEALNAHLAYDAAVTAIYAPVIESILEAGKKLIELESELLSIEGGKS